MGRSPSSDENGLKKGPWTPEEDQKLMQYIQEHGLGSWRALPKLAGLNRCGKSCRLRWTNYLRPDIKRGKFSQDEEQTILHLHSILGNKWSAIASHLPGRTDNEIKNFWNTHLRKKLIQMGFDPMTHQPRTDFFSTLPQLISLLNLRDLMEHYPQHQYPLDEQTLKFQSESVQLAKLQCLQYLLQSAAANSTTTATTTTTIADMEVSNLLNSINIPPIKENPILNSLQLENIIAPPLTSLENIASSSSHHLLHHPIIPLTHLPADPQAVPFSDFQTLLPLNNHDDQMMGQASSFTVVNQGDNYYQNYPPNSSWVNNNITSPSPSLSPEFSVPPRATEILMNNNIIQGDENSTSSYGGGEGGASSSSYWPELLFENPLMHEIP